VKVSIEYAVGEANTEILTLRVRMTAWQVDGDGKVVTREGFGGG